MSIVSSLKNDLLSLVGWRSQRKIVVIESDDWGSIRMPSIDAFNRLSEAGFDLGPANSMRFNWFDRIEGPLDVEGLLNVLYDHRDMNGRKAVITNLCLVANPDFEKIENGQFEEYAYELFPATLERYYPGGNVWPIWQAGIADGLFTPQFHGREHLNIHHWLKALKNNDASARMAFKERVWGFNNAGISYQAAFDFYSPEEIAEHERIMEDGLNAFEELFGYRATFFVPPNGLLSEKLYKPAYDNGIRYLYSSRKHTVPVGRGHYNTQFNYIGKMNSAGQRFITRNAFFEPSLGGRDWVSSCLKEIETAFRWRKPAVISSHRVNFMGGLVEANRKNGLARLDELLKKITLKWPNVEFMTTPELGQLMSKG